MKLILEKLNWAGGPNQRRFLATTKGRVEEIRHTREGSCILQKVKCWDPIYQCAEEAG